MSRRSASLAQLAVHVKLIPMEQAQRLRKIVKARSKTGKPTSFGRLLVKGGLTSKELRHLLRKGAALPAVRCDACSQEVDQEGMSERREYPCTKCGAKILPFRPFLKGEGKKGRERRERESRRNPKMVMDDSSGEVRPRTMKLPAVPEPGQPAASEVDAMELSPIADIPAPSEQTVEHGKVIPIPSLQAATPTSDHDDVSTLAFENIDGSTVPYEEIIEIPSEDLVAAEGGGTTYPFDHIFRLPGAQNFRSEEETIMEFRALVEESEEDDPKPGFILPEPSLEASDAIPSPSPDPKRIDSRVGGKLVGGFQMIHSLGSGAVGHVFLARRKSDGFEVALKVLRPEAAADPEFLKRFQREARAAARVQHKNVVSVIDSGQDPSTKLWYLALEYVKGGSLMELLDESPQLPERRALEIVRGCCEALVAAAEEGIIHRDIKPENIMLDERGQPKLTDLGLAKQLDTTTRITQTGVVVGTPVYISPEQALGEVELDIRTDIYSLGFCLWEMLTGVVPFADDDAPPLEVVVRHIEEDLPDVRIYAPTISDETAQVVRGMAARNRDERYPSPTEVIRDIDLVLSGKAPLGSGSGDYGEHPRASDTAMDQVKKASDKAALAMGETIEVPPPSGAVAAAKKKKKGGCVRCGFCCLFFLILLLPLGAWGMAWASYYQYRGELPVEVPFDTPRPWPF